MISSVAHSIPNPSNMGAILFCVTVTRRPLTRTRLRLGGFPPQTGSECGFPLPFLPPSPILYCGTSWLPRATILNFDVEIALQDKNCTTMTRDFVHTWRSLNIVSIKKLSYKSNCQQSRRHQE